jgi:hypothetical protein
MFLSPDSHSGIPIMTNNIKFLHIVVDCIRPKRKKQVFDLINCLTGRSWQRVLP